MTQHFKMKLIHKGLLLLSLPLLVQFVFIICVESMLSSARKERRVIEDGLEISAQCTDTVGRIVTLRTSLLLPDSHAISSLKLALEKDLRSLGESLSENVSDRTTERMCKSLYSEAVKLVAELPQSTSSEQSSIQASEIRLMKAQERITKIRQLLPQPAPLDVDSLKQKELQIQQVLAFGLVANVVLCPVLVLLFSRDVSSRLSLLVANSQKLARGEELLGTQAEADDEIAQLDTVFRKMAKEISDARSTEQQFLSMVSHDLKTPLNSVYGTLTLLNEGVYGELSDTAKQKIGAAEDSINRLLLLTNDLLDLERIRTGRIALDIQSKALQPILEGACQAVSGFAQFKNIAVKCDNTDLQIMADEQRLTQVLVNLLSNAIKFSGDGDAVTVSSHRDGSVVEISVKDNGPGIAEAAQKEIFERFNAAAVAAKNERGTQSGSGLGLSICKAIVDEHNGTIGVRSEVGKGSVFWIRLKLATI